MKFFPLLAFAVLSALPLFAADGLRITFSPETYSKKTKLPEKWHLQGKLFTAKPDYEIVFDKALNTNVLRVTTATFSAGAIPTGNWQNTPKTFRFMNGSARPAVCR